MGQRLVGVGSWLSLQVEPLLGSVGGRGCCRWRQALWQGYCMPVPAFHQPALTVPS